MLNYLQMANVTLLVVMVMTLVLVTEATRHQHDARLRLLDLEPDTDTQDPVILLSSIQSPSSSQPASAKNLTSSSNLASSNSPIAAEEENTITPSAWNVDLHDALQTAPETQSVPGVGGAWRGWNVHSTETLHDILRSSGPLPPQTSRSIFQMILNIFQEAGQAAADTVRKENLEADGQITDLGENEIHETPSW